MNTYVMLTRLSPDALRAPAAVENLNRQVNDRIKQECSGINWLANYPIAGPCDYVDIFEAPDSDTATKEALLVRSLDRATAQLWTATPWGRFVDLARHHQELADVR